MSALSNKETKRSAGIYSGAAYDELRSKVAALVRPEKANTAAQRQASPMSGFRPSYEDANNVVPVRADHADAARDTSSVYEILTRATSCFDLLSQKLDQVESERDEALSLVEDHKRAAASWEEMIDAIQARMQDAERDLVAMKQELVAEQARCNKAEERVAQLDETLNLRDRRLSEVESQYASLYDQVITSFGLGSATHRVLERLVQRFHEKAA